MIVTQLIYPPIPIRRFGRGHWMAHIKGHEDGPTGYGSTEIEALRDLCEQLAEKLFNEEESV